MLRLRVDGEPRLLPARRWRLPEETRATGARHQTPSAADTVSPAGHHVCKNNTDHPGLQPCCTRGTAELRRDCPRSEFLLRCGYSCLCCELRGGGTGWGCWLTMATTARP